MTSVNSTPWGPVTPGQPASHTAERILDVAWDLFVAQGVAATTVSQIAAGAGISREWLYRHFENRHAIVRALLAREVHGFIAEVARRGDPGADPVELAIDTFVYCVRFLRGHELLQRILVTESELVAPFLTSQAGPLMRTGVDFARAFFTARAGLPPVRARRVAEVLVRLLASIAVTRDVAINLDDPRQLRAFATNLISPLLAT